MRQLLLDNSENVSAWLTMVAEGDPERDIKPDPGKALDLISKLAEFSSPKLARTELAGDPDAPVQTVSRVELVPLGTKE